MRDSFVLFTSINEVLQELEDEQKGQLFQAIIDYQMGNEVKLDKFMKVVFIPIKQMLDSNNEKWEETKRKRSEAGKKGMQKRWNKDITKDNNVITSIINDNNVITKDNKNNKAKNDITKITVYDNVNVNVNVNDNIKYKYVVDKYNDICKSLPKVKTLSDKRKRSIKNIVKKYGYDKIEEVFKMCEESDFLKGVKTSWRANLDWLMNDTNFCKVLDGNYTNNSNNKPKNTFQNFPQREHTEKELNDLERILRV